MKCQYLISGKNKKNDTKLSSAELDERLVKVKGKSKLGIKCMSNNRHYENMPFQIYSKFHLQKLKIFR